MSELDPQVERGVLDLLGQESSSFRNDTLPVGRSGRCAKTGSETEKC